MRYGLVVGWGRDVADKQLTGKQKLFVVHYIATLNGTKAARLAGYKGDDATLSTIAYENLRKHDIREAIDAAFAEQIMSANEVLMRLASHARGDMGDFAHVAYVSDIQQHESARLIKKFKRTIRTDKDDTRTEQIEIELYDAQAAMVHLGRYHKLWTDKQEMTGKDGEGIEINFRLINKPPDDHD